MPSPATFNRFMNDAISTASPGRLLVMLYERLLLDLDYAEKSLRAGEHEPASERLLHAQEIILELRVTLDMKVWDGAAALADIYSFLVNELVTANVQRDAERVASCRSIIEPLTDAWRAAAESAQVATEPAGRRVG